MYRIIDVYETKADDVYYYVIVLIYPSVKFLVVNKMRCVWFN